MHYNYTVTQSCDCEQKIPFDDQRVVWNVDQLSLSDHVLQSPG